MDKPYFRPRKITFLMPFADTVGDV